MPRFMQENVLNREGFGIMQGKLPHGLGLRMNNMHSLGKDSLSKGTTLHNRAPNVPVIVSNEHRITCLTKSPFSGHK